MEIIDAACEVLGRFCHLPFRKMGLLRNVEMTHGGYVVVGYFIVFFGFVAQFAKPLISLKIPFAQNSGKSILINNLAIIFATKLS